MLLSRDRIELPLETWDQPRPVEGLTEWRIPSSRLLEDYDIVARAFRQIHPGLYRYNDEASLDHHLQQLKRSLHRDLTIGEAYLAFSRFAGAIRCGHTYANFFNQNSLVRQVILEQPDKLPFTFRLVDRRLIITGNASGDDRLGRGAEILSVNGRPVGEILDSLLLVVKADGSNDGKRLNDLQVSGYNYYEAFDVYFPLFFPPANGKYVVEGRNLVGGERLTVKVDAVTRQERSFRLAEQGHPLPRTYDELWEFRLLDDNIAYLKLGTFVVWRFEMDWKAFLKNAFREIEKRKVRHLILDIRDNEGGLDEVVVELFKYLVRGDFTYQGWEEKARCSVIPEDLRSYLKTWDPSVFDRSHLLESIGDGFYTWKSASSPEQVVKAGKKAFTGEVYVLVNGANSSATFYLADYIRQGKLAKLAGQPTGGNLRGINGGTLLFLHLPHSMIELDLPIVGSFATGERPDRGILPDIMVKPEINDIIESRDTELEYVKALIREGQ